jgi:RHS repeat-associated protein
MIWLNYTYYQANIATIFRDIVLFFDFNTKENDNESGCHYYDFGYSDILTGWLSVDPMADKYPNISPYAYCAWNPVKLVDLDGEELTDFYDISTGAHLKHVDDGIDQAIAIDANVFKACEDDNDIEFAKSLGVSLGSNTEFVSLAGTLYAESTAEASSLEEMAAIGSVIRNRADADNSSYLDVISSKRYSIYGYAERDKINHKLANSNKVNLAYKAAMLTIATETDYSNGAYFWHGKDFAIKGSNAYLRFYKRGFLFTDKSHDVYNMGSFQKQGNVPYTYESTAAFCKTTFMRLTTNWMKANGAKHWSGRAK